MSTFLLAALGVIVGFVIIKNFKMIFGIVVAILLLLLNIIILPFRLLKYVVTYSEEKYVTIVTMLYDEIFFQDNSRKKVNKHMKKIHKLEKKIEKMKIREEERKTVKFLNEVKWVI